jgi:hypothetical protein
MNFKEWLLVSIAIQQKTRREIHGGFSFRKVSMLMKQLRPIGRKDLLLNFHPGV